jgi:hypothetical protein
VSSVLSVGWRTVGVVGVESHSFFPFLSFFLSSIIPENLVLSILNKCFFQIFSKIHSCSTTEQCSPQQGQMP